MFQYLFFIFQPFQQHRNPFTQSDDSTLRLHLWMCPIPTSTTTLHISTSRATEYLVFCGQTCMDSLTNKLDHPHPNSPCPNCTFLRTLLAPIPFVLSSRSIPHGVDSGIVDRHFSRSPDLRIPDLPRADLISTRLPKVSSGGFAQP